MGAGGNLKMFTLLFNLIITAAICFNKSSLATDVELPSCSTSTGNVKNGVMFCQRANEEYPKWPYLIQPFIEVRDIIDVNEVDNSITVYIHILSVWNDSITVHNNSKIQQR